jgi:hypothetical protein
LDGYPRQRTETGEIIDVVDGRFGKEGVFPAPTFEFGMNVYELNDVSNSWPFYPCTMEGAKDAAGNLPPDALAKLDVLQQSVINNADRYELGKAAEAFPDAPWAAAFKAEAESTDSRFFRAEAPVAAEAAVVEEPKGFGRFMLQLVQRFGSR